MSLFKQLAKLWYILPVAIISIVILDLVRNRSLVTQYLHWTVYAVVGTTAAIFTGNMHSFEFECITLISITNFLKMFLYVSPGCAVAQQVTCATMAAVLFLSYIGKSLSFEQTKSIT